MDAGIPLKNANPKAKATIFSKLFFFWIIELYRKSLRQGLHISDLYKTLDSDKSEFLTNKLEENWRKEIENANKYNRQPKLLTAITKTFFGSYMVYGGILFVQHVFLRAFQPVVLSYLIALFDTSEENQEQMYISSTILIGISLLVVFSMHHSNFGQASIGMRIRVAISSLIYRKTLKLNLKSLNQTPVGQVVNLLSNDVTRFDLVIVFLHYLWILPFQVSLIAYLLWSRIGIAAWAGVLSVIILSLPGQGYLGKVTSNYRLKVAQKTDHRVTLMSEIISGIQVIKMYAWEKPFENIVRLARIQEVNALTITSYLRGSYLSFMIFVERVALFLSLLTLLLIGQPILPQEVFSMAQFFNLLQLTMSVFYPMAISYGAETLVSIDRIQQYLLMKENEKSEIETDFDEGIVLENIQTSWLKEITLEIPQGCLCAIVGGVGSGKSSLLHLLLNELKPNSGTIKIQGCISYSSQEPWLFASTIRNNILFGAKYEKHLYNQVVKVCALQKDFEQLYFADRTLVGERGTALSGGQKARVNLARAIYRDADVYLLDDPLSAVDTHVGKHLFQECILKYLRGKTRLLVTHQLQYLKKVDLIIVMNNGRIEARGTYEELSHKITFIKELLAEEVVDKENALNQKSALLLSNSFMLESGNPLSQKDDAEESTPVWARSPLKEYIQASGNYCQIFFALATLLGCQFFCSAADYWVTVWTHQEAIKNLNITTKNNETLNFITSGFNESIVFIDSLIAIYIYGVIIALLVIITMVRSWAYFSVAMKSSVNLHNKMFTRLLKVPMNFFYTNPSGRILNRFSKDMGAIDEILPKVLLEATQITLVFCGILVMVVISNIYMIIAVIVMGITFMKIRSWFIYTTKDIKHLEGITKSPVFSHLNASLQGVITIRAFDAGELLQHEFDCLQNVHTSAWFLTITCMASFGLWLDLMCVIFITCTIISFIILDQFDQVSGSLVGLAISQSLILTGMLQYGIRQSAEVANQLTSVERILQYTDLDKEGPFSTLPENRPPASWPTQGAIEIKNLFLQYSPNDPPVLKNISVKIKAGQKIGIVGRTGAGKSSMIAALFRLTDIMGNILIDGVDINTLGLHDLRKNISIIPQEPVLFSETVRYNLDPFEEFDDEKLWQVLEEVELKEQVLSLDYMVAASGRNFSVGQRQLVCLARAILRNNKILILDEATANIDQKTDSLIQQTIRRKFKSCTVLTVAHRLNTIMDSDRVIVMDDGEIVEFDYPYKLLQKPETIFYKMVTETGLTMSLHLEDMAFHAFLNRRLQED